MRRAGAFAYLVLLALAVLTPALEAAESAATCLGKRATITGTARADRLVGTRRADVILARAGNDRVIGNGGADVICGGAGNDRVSGGTGGDRVAGEDGEDILTGGTGGDVLEGGTGGDRMGGGRGVDRLNGGDGDDSLYGGHGADVLDPGGGADRMFGGPGADTFEPGPGAAVVDPDPDSDGDDGDPSRAPGEDVEILHPSAEHLLGPDAEPTDTTAEAEWNDAVRLGPGDDVVAASPGDDAISGGGGSDRVDGGAGTDTLEGGEGDDTLDGGASGDLVAGGDGSDQLAGGDGGDELSGGDGADRVSGGDGRDQLNGGSGGDDLDGGAERDAIDGGTGDDALAGGDGGDELRGGPDDEDGADTIDGGADVDDIEGGAGGDTIAAGGGDDAIFGGPGDDSLNGGGAFDNSYGGPGTDTCADGEEVFLCERVEGQKDSALPTDQPPERGTCDAWASTAGDDGGPGTAARPYRTVERLANTLAPGQTGCLVGGAVYEEPDHQIHIRRAGEMGQPTTIRSAPAGPRATIKGRLWVDQAAHDLVITEVNLDGQNPLALLRGAGEALPSPTVNGDRVTLYANDITNNRVASCIAVGSVEGYGVAEDFALRGNNVHDCGKRPPHQYNGDVAMFLEASRDAVIRGNVFSESADRGILVYPDAQRSLIEDNLIERNRMGIHIGAEVAPAGWIHPEGSFVMPEHNVIRNNVIRDSTLAYSDEYHWQVDGYKSGWANQADPPSPQGNTVDGNCMFYPDPSRNFQSPAYTFEVGPGNFIAPASNACPASFGPEGMPAVETGAARASDTGAEVDWRVEDRSRVTGSLVRVEWISSDGASAGRTDPVTLGPGETGSGAITLAGLPAGAYTYRVIAESASGVAYGELRAFVVGAGPSPPPPPALPDPVRGKSFNVATVNPNRVKVAMRGVGAFHSLKNDAQVTVGSDIDARRGPARVTTAAPGRGRRVAEATVRTSKATLKLNQSPNSSLADLRLAGGSFRGCRASARRASAARVRRESTPVRKGRVTGSGPYRLRGRYAAASVRGTDFTLVDRCDGTLVTVKEGRVAVRDLVRRKTVLVRAGRRYLARAR